MPGPKKIVTGIARTIGFLPMLYFGRWGIPLGIAKPQKLTVCMGLPIELAKEENPTKERIEDVHRKYIVGLKQVFEKNKKQMGYGDRELVIV